MGGGSDAPDMKEPQSPSSRCCGPRSLPGRPRVARFRARPTGPVPPGRAAIASAWKRKSCALPRQCATWRRSPTVSFRYRRMAMVARRVPPNGGPPARPASRTDPLSTREQSALAPRTRSQSTRSGGRRGRWECGLLPKRHPCSRENSTARALLPRREHDTGGGRASDQRDQHPHVRHQSPDCRSLTAASQALRRMTPDAPRQDKTGC